MDCSIEGIRIKGDTTGKIEKALSEIKNIEERNIVAVHINDGTFLNFIKDYHKKDYNEKLPLTEYNGNTIKKLIKDFAAYLDNNVQNYDSSKYSKQLMGFTENSALTEAINYTGDCIINEHNANLSRPVEERRSKNAILGRVRDSIFSEAIKRAEVAISLNPNKTIILDEEKKTLSDILKEINDIKKEIANSKSEINRLNNLLKDKNSKANRKNIKTAINAELIKRNQNVIKAAFLAHIVLSSDSSIQNKNYGALVYNLISKGDYWFDETFKTQKLLDISKSFTDASIFEAQEWSDLNEEDYSEDDDAFLRDIESEIDSSTKNWNDGIVTSFLKYYNNRLTTYLSNLYERTSPIVGNTDENAALRTSDYLGIPVKMDARYLITQITNIMNGSSLEAFVDSLERAANTIPSLYGVGKIVNDMRNDPYFAYFVFSQFKKPLIAKNMIILGKDGINVIQSNNEAFVTSKLFYDFNNDSQITYISEFKENEEENISNILTKLSSYKDNAKFVKEYQGKVYSFIEDFFSRHFPSINKIDIQNYVYKDSNNAIKVAKDILEILKEYSKGIETSNINRSKYKQEFSKKVKSWGQARIDAVQQGRTFYAPKPRWEEEKINKNAQYSAIIKLSNLFKDVIPVRTKLNTSNAEGKMSSNLIKNSYITNLVNQIKEDLNNGGNGVEILKDFLTKQKYNTSQFEYSTIIFGIPGKVEGMFTKSHNKYTVNKKFFDAFNISLFDGIKDSEGEGLTYKQMSQNDFLMSQIQMFGKPIRYSGNTDEEVKGFANYLMRIPSDASNIFAVQMPRYSHKDLYSYDEGEINTEITNRKRFVNEKTDVNDKQIISIHNDIVAGRKSLDKANTIGKEKVLDIFINNIPDKINKTKYTTFELNDNEVLIPLRYTNKETKNFFIVYLKATKEGNYYINPELVNISSTVKKTTSDIVEESINLLEEGASPETIIENSSYNTKPTNGELDSFIDSNRQFFIDYGVSMGTIAKDYNRNSVMFLAFKQQLLGEINNFVAQLNSVFEKEGDRYITKTSDKNLFKLLHTDSKGNIVVDGKLAGNIFKFTKLFNINGSNLNVNDILSDFLNLYGHNDSIFKKSGDRLVLNLDNAQSFIRQYKGNLVFSSSEELENKLNDIVEQWLDAYTKYITSQANDLSSILNIEGNNINFEDFVLNTTLAYYAFDDLFEGSSKYYKDAQTFLKRAKETQMSGSSYGAFDFNDITGGPLRNTKDATGKEVIIDVPGLETYAKIGSKIESSPMYLRTGFRAVTVQNTIGISSKESLDTMFDQIYKHILETTGDEVLATDIANQICQGYGRDYIDKNGNLVKGSKTKFNDAQSFITFEEFVRRKVADGTYKEYESLIKQLADPNVDVTKLDLSKINTRIQVQKNVYYDVQFDEETGMYYPRQIKNAEYVLIPALIKGTDLEKVYAIMHRNDIGQLNTAETSKAAQRNIMTLWDNNGVPHFQEFEESITGQKFENYNPINGGQTSDVYNDYPVENYYYSNLYKQEDIQDHIKDEVNKAGIQIMKKLLDSYYFVSENTRQAIDRIQDAFTDNINQSFDKLLDDMGWEYDNGRIVNKLSDEDIEGLTEVEIANKRNNLRFNKFLELARREGQRLKLDKDTLQYLTPDEDGNLIMPLWMNNVSTKLEAVIQSIWKNRIIRQELAGWHGTQVTSIGYDNNLKYRPNGENTMQIKVAPWNSYISKLVKEQGKDAALAYLRENGLDKQILYRIPTEGKQSVIVGVIEDLLPEAEGSNVIVPNEWVTQSGSDFDRDSIYAIVHEIDKEGHKLENNNNTITEAMIEIMLSEDSIEEMLGRSNFDELGESIKINRKLDGSGFGKASPYNPFDQLRFMQNAIDGKKLKAFSVNRDTLNSINGKLRTKLHNKYAINVIYNDGNYNEKHILNSYDAQIEKEELEYPIQPTFPGKNATKEQRQAYIYAKLEYNEKLAKYLSASKNKQIIVSHNMLGWSRTGRNVVGRLIGPYSSQTTAHILDAIKEGAIKNENEYTFKVFKTLLDVGVDTDTSVAWLMLPGISRIVKNYFNNNSIYISESGNPINKTLKELALEMNLKGITQNSTIEQIYDAFASDPDVVNKIGKVKNIKSYNFPLNKREIKNRLSNKENTKENLIFDFVTTLQFNHIQIVANAIENVGRVLRPEGNAIKQSIKATREFDENVKKYRNPKDSINEILYAVNDEGRAISVMDAIYPLRGSSIDVENSGYKYLAAFYEKGILPSIEVNRKLIPTESDSFIALMKSIQLALGTETLSDKNYDTIKKYIIGEVYNTLLVVNSPITITENGFVIPDYAEVESEKDLPYWEQEQGRIAGFVKDSKYDNTTLSVEEFMNPSQEFISEYVKFTPLQKINFIKRCLGTKRGIFDLIEARIANTTELENKGYSANKLYVNDTSSNTDDIKNLFEKAFYSKNPLIKLAAIDLVKYAFVVEGFKFKKNSITKIIKNDILLADIKSKGLNIINECKSQFDIISDVSNFINNNYIDRLARANSSIIRKLYIKKPTESKENKNEGDLFKECLRSNKLVIIPKIKSYESLISNFKNDKNTYSGNYRNIVFNKENILYKIVEMDKCPYIFLVPLDKLEENEHSNQSINPNNITSQIVDYSYYEHYIRTFKDKYDSREKLTEENISDIANEITKSINGKSSEYARKRYDKTKAFSKDVEKNSLINVFDSTDEKRKIPVRRFVSEIEDAIIDKPESVEDALILNNNPTIKNILGLKVTGDFVYQNVFINDEIVEVKITKYNSRPYYNRKNDKSIKASEIDSSFEYYYDKFNNEGKLSKDIYPDIYKIEIESSPEVNEEIDNINEEEQQENYSLLDEISEFTRKDPTDNLTTTLTESAEIAQLIGKAIRRDSYIENDKKSIANKTLDKLAYQHIYLDSKKSIDGRTDSMLSIVLKYYQDKAAYLNSMIDSFKLSDGTFMSIDDLELYRKIQQNDEDFNNLLSFLLQAKTFGETLGINAGIKFESSDKETQRVIDEIQRLIKSITDNNKINKAFTNIFNIYLAESVSTNPLVRSHILNITDNFSDIDFFDRYFAATTELPHKQIQLIAKLIHQQVNKGMYEGRIAAAKFEEEYNKLLTDKVDMDKLIDKDGKFYQRYSPKFLEDKEKFEKDIQDLVETKGNYAKETFEKELEYAAWKLNHTEQRLIDRFYATKLSAEREVYKELGETYLEFKRISDNINNLEELDNLTEEQENQLLKYKEERQNIINDNKALVKYMGKIGKLYKEFYKEVPTVNFTRTLKSSLSYIEKYDMLHPNETMEEKLMDEQYKIAYDWLSINSNKRLNKKTQDILTEAFATLRGEVVKGTSKFDEIKDTKDVLRDAFGEIIGTKFTAEEQKAISDDLKEKYNVGNYNEGSRYSDSQLIKDVPEGVILSDKFWKEEIFENNVSEELLNQRKELYTRANKILGKGIPKETGRLDFDTLYNRCTSAELDELISIFSDIKDINRQISKDKSEDFDEELAKKEKTPFVKKVNKVAFGEQYLKYKTYDAAKRSYFEQLFCETKSNFEPKTNKKGEFYANPLIYGYYDLKKNKKGEYIRPDYVDEARTKARDTINKNVEYRTTKYYDEELIKVQKESDRIFDEAIASGKTEKEATQLAQNYKDEWFDRNHYYNKYEHRYVPIPIWTNLHIKESGDLSGDYTFDPTPENYTREIRDEKFLNPKYKEFNNNYKESTNSKDGKDYSNPVKLNSDEIAMLEYLTSTMNMAATNYVNTKFIEQGYVPRLRKEDTSLQKVAIDTGLSLLGIYKRNYNDREFRANVDYSHDYSKAMSMLQLLKGKGYQPLIKIEEQGSMSDEAYTKYKNDIKKQNDEIRKRNQEIDAALLNRDWLKVFKEFVYNSSIYNAKQNSKNLGYLMIEDLKDRKNIKVNNYGKVTKYSENQTSSIEVFEQFLRKILFDEYKEMHRLAPIADTLQGMASARYMMLNLYAGIANVNTGLVNIAGEYFAQDYFSRNSYRKGMARYFQNVPSYLRDMYSDKASTFESGLIKLFNVVEIDSKADFLGKEEKFDVSAAANRINELTFMFQSGGEHMMQNGVLFAALEDNKVYQDPFNGKWVFGSFNDYTQNIEYLALKESIKGDPVKEALLNQLLAEIKSNNQLKYEFDTLRKNIVQEFVKLFASREEKLSVVSNYRKTLDEYTEQARKEFEKLPSMLDQFEYDSETGVTRIKSDSHIDASHIGAFKQRVIGINHRIHGVYDKVGGGNIERKWYGNLLTQFHKHLYPGIMKRYRTRGFYNEVRGTNEKGSYVSSWQLLFGSFKQYRKDLKADLKAKNDYDMFGAIRSWFTALIDNFYDINIRWATMPEWERRNVQRVCGDLAGIGLPLIMIYLMYALWDDDDMEDNYLINSALYLADRLYTESNAFTPFGLYSEAKTLYNSPIAGAGGMRDIVQLGNYSVQFIFDPKFKPIYDRGTYKGENKFIVPIKRNIPIIRQVNRIQHINKSNNYYRIGENVIATKVAKNLGLQTRDWWKE